MTCLLRGRSLIIFSGTDFIEKTFRGFRFGPTRTVTLHSTLQSKLNLSFYSLYLFVCFNVEVSVFLSILLSVYLSIYPSIQQPTTFLKGSIKLRSYLSWYLYIPCNLLSIQNVFHSCTLPSYFDSFRIYLIRPSNNLFVHTSIH